MPRHPNLTRITLLLTALALPFATLAPVTLATAAEAVALLELDGPCNYYRETP